MILIIPPIDYEQILIEIEDGYTDNLTGCLNRRAFDKYKSEDTDRLLLYYFDLDGLKKLNDSQGHKAGDEFIRDNADLLRQTFKRDTDFIFRIGGDEFIVISDYPPSLNHLINFSIGVSVIAEDVETAIVEADKAMYLDKMLDKRLMND